MATIHIFLNDNEVRQAVHQYLSNRGVDVALVDIHFIEASSGEQIDVEVEAMKATLTESYKGFDK
jgi:hypothetical protein